MSKLLVTVVLLAQYKNSGSNCAANLQGVSTLLLRSTTTLSSCKHLVSQPAGTECSLERERERERERMVSVSYG